MQMERNGTMNQEQNAVQKGTFREQNKREEGGGRREGKEKKKGKQNIMKTL